MQQIPFCDKNRRNDRCQCTAEFSTYKCREQSRLRCKGKSHMGGQQAGTAYEKSSESHFPFFIQIMISGERGERTDKPDQHGGEALRTKSQSGSKAGERLSQKSAQQFRSRQASKHDNTDGGDNTHGIFERSHAGQGIEAAERFHSSQYQTDSDKDTYTVGQQAEDSDHLFGYFPQAEQKRQCGCKYGQILQQAFRNGETGQQAAGGPQAWQPVPA